MDSSCGCELKENQVPLQADGSDDEVFFGNVTEKERSKMKKMRRKTEVFVPNFRAEVSNDMEKSVVQPDASFMSQGSADSHSVSVSLATSLQSSGQKEMDTALMKSPVVIVPNHTPDLMEISPQQNAHLLPLESLEPFYKCQENYMTAFAFNTVDDNVNMEFSNSVDPSSKLTELYVSVKMQQVTTDPDILQCKSSKCVTSEAKSGSFAKNETSPAPQMDNTGSFLSSGLHSIECTCRESSSCDYLQADPISRWSDGQTSCICSVVSCVNTITGCNDASHKPLRQIQKSHIDAISSMPNISLDRIQSPTVFSSPRLFPVTVQAVQSQLSIPSAVLFSPLKFSEHKQYTNINSRNCSYANPEAPDLQSVSASKLVEVEDQATRSQSARITLSLSTDPQPSHISPHKTSTLEGISVARNAKPDLDIAKATTHITADPHLPPKIKSGCQAVFDGSHQIHNNVLKADSLKQIFPSPDTILNKRHERVCLYNTMGVEAQSAGLHSSTVASHMERGMSQGAKHKLELLKQKKGELARIRAQKAKLQQTLKTENEMCLAMKQDIQLALRSNTSHADIPVHLLSLGCQGVSSLTLTEQELDIVTRLHTIHNSQHEVNTDFRTSQRQVTQHKEPLHLKWHSSLVTEVHQLSSPSHHGKVLVARPVLSKSVSGWK